MRGAACKHGGLHPISMSNHEVLRWWRICPTHLELAILRAQWLQSMVGNTDAHGQLIAILWGQMRGEDDHVLDQAGFLNPYNSNSFVLRFQSDLEILRSQGAFSDFFEIFPRDDKGYNWQILFGDEYLRELFSAN